MCGSWSGHDRWKPLKEAVFTLSLLLKLLLQPLHGSLSRSHTHISEIVSGRMFNNNLDGDSPLRVLSFISGP